jgi:hypothetical protein
MARIPIPIILCVAILVSGILVAGCSDQSTGQGSPGTPTAAATLAPTPGLAPKYTAGDVVRSPGSASDQGWLIISYDSAADKYQRALIMKNSYGNWYRSSTSSENADRAVVDKVYSVRITTVNPSSVPVVTPTTAPTTVATTRAPTTSPTPTPKPAPAIQKTIPDSAVFNTTASGVQISGTNFQTGAKVFLQKTDSPAINGTNLNVASSTLIICDFVIGDVPHGSWDVVVTNPDGQSYTLANWFTITSG